MSEKPGTVRSQLFTLRVWVEEVATDTRESRGLVRHVHSGASIYFRDWSTLVAFLEQWSEADVTDAPLYSPE